MDSTLTIKNFNKVNVPQDTVIIVPAQAQDINIHQPEYIDYSLQFWGLLVVLLIIGFLYFFKKEKSTIMPTYITEQMPTENIKYFNKKEELETEIKIETENKKLSFAEPTESFIKAETIKTKE